MRRRPPVLIHAHAGSPGAIHRHLDVVRKHIDAGFDEIYVQQIGPDQEAFFEGWANEVLPQLR